VTRVVPVGLELPREAGAWGMAPVRPELLPRAASGWGMARVAPVRPGLLRKAGART
jgi:hypothetical protein